MNLGLRIRIVICAWLVLHAPTSADEVVYQDSRGKSQRYQGTILDYLGDTLRIDVRGREIAIRGDGIQQIDSHWLPQHAEADASFERHQFAAALESYKRSFNGETRRWVKRRILAQIVRCQRNEGIIAQSCQNFGRLVSDDPQTPYFDAIPLAWASQPTAEKLKTSLQPWLAKENPSALRLLAMSWLLAGDQRLAARVLRELAQDPDTRVAGLAVAQFWRTKTATAGSADVERWRTQLREIPRKLRAGPYFLIGQAELQQKRWDQAALAFLRVPTTYPDQALLSRLSLLEAAKALREAGRDDEARNLFHQTAQLSPDSIEGRYARSQLEP